jgi:hypothetical protein
MGEPLAQEPGEQFWRRCISPEEVRRNRIPPPQFNGSFRWFRSPNIIDLWVYRDPEAKARILKRHCWR